MCGCERIESLEEYTPGKNVKDMNKVLELAHKHDVACLWKEGDLMVCSPVGNQDLFAADNEPQVRLAISGFCTAPAASLSYLTQLDQSGRVFNSAALRRATFDSGKMRKNLSEILESVGLVDAQGVIEENLTVHKRDKALPVYLTQLLCMIAPNGGSAAPEVEKLLKSRDRADFRRQAQHCLTSWLKRLQKILKEDGALLVMGSAACELLYGSFYDMQCDSVSSIDFSVTPQKGSLYEFLENRFRLFHIPHASLQGWGMPATRNRWLSSGKAKDERSRLHNWLLTQFEDKVLDTIQIGAVDQRRYHLKDAVWDILKSAHEKPITNASIYRELSGHFRDYRNNKSRSAVIGKIMKLLRDAGMVTGNGKSGWQIVSSKN